MKGYSRDQLFEGMEQVDIFIAGHKLKMPIFYRDSAMFGAVYPARISAIKQLLPEEDLHPARLAPGFGIISVTAFQHRNTDIYTHNEIVVSAMISSPDYVNVPLYNIAQQVRNRHMFWYVLHMPVTSDIALISGLKQHGFARTRADISFIQSNENILCTVKDKDQLVLMLSGSKIDAFSSGFMENTYFTFQNGLVQRCTAKTVALQWGRSYSSEEVRLTLGKEHTICRDLKSAMVSDRSLMYIYAPRIQSVVFGPENMQPVLLKTSVDSFFPQAHLADKVDRRFHPREKVDILCEIDGSTRGQRSHINAHVVDLSPRGMFVETGTPLDEDTEIRAAVHAGQPENPVWVKGRVARLEPHGIAVSFIEKIPEDLDHIIFH